MRDDCLKALVKYGQANACLSTVEEYIREAQHQDGEEYWENHFSSPDEAIEDFVLYHQNVEEEEMDDTEVRAYTIATFSCKSVAIDLLRDKFGDGYTVIEIVQGNPPRHQQPYSTSGSCGSFSSSGT
jgi:hypothetical protein